MASSVDTDLSKVPIMPNPSGAPPDFLGGPSLHGEITDSGIALLVISGLFLILRLATNVKVARKLGFDDLLCIIAFFGGAGYWAFNLYISQQGATKHAWDVPLSSMTPTMAEIQVAILILIALTMWAAKSAVLALYIRVFGSIVWLQRTAYTWIIFMALVYSMNIIVGGVYCIPRKGEVWGGGPSFLRCSSTQWPFIVVGVFSCLADMLILLLPFPIILKLHVDFRRKVALSIVFGAGIILVGLSIVSLYLRVLLLRGGDATWNAALLALLTVVQIFGTVMVSCAPATSSFWQKILIQSTLWTEIKSSSIYSSLRSRFPKQSSTTAKPSFVLPYSRTPPSAHKYNLTNSKDTAFILKGQTSNLSEVDSLGESANDFITSPLR